MKKPIYVDEEIYDFLTTMRKDYGNYNNAIKAILHRLGSIYEELEIFRGKINHKESFEENLLMESVKHPQSLSTSSSVRNETLVMNQVPTRPPPLPDKGIGRDLQLVFNAMGNVEGVKPSDFLKTQDEVLEKKLLPPPPPPKKIQNLEPIES